MSGHLDIVDSDDRERFGYYQSAGMRFLDASDREDVDTPDEPGRRVLQRQHQ